MKTRTVLSLAALALVFAFASGCVPTALAQQSTSKIVLPPDTNVVPPGPEVSKELAAFSGKWYGWWYGERTGTNMGEYILVVEEITPLSAKVISAGITRWGVAYATRYTAKVANGSLVFTNKNGKELSFTVSKDGKTLNGVTQFGLARNLAVLTRVDEVD